MIFDIFKDTASIFGFIIILIAAEALLSCWREKQHESKRRRFTVEQGHRRYWDDD